MVHKLLLVSLPLAGSALYLTYLHISLSGKVQCQTTPFLQDEDVAVPNAVRKSPGHFIIHHECARKTISTASLNTASSADLLVPFLRHTMATFTKRPPAWGIWYLIKDAKGRATFSQAYLRSLDFMLGDRVCGTYVVTSREKDRVTLTLDAPESYVGPQVEGILVVEIKEEGSRTTFANHTVMWREKGKGSAGVLEGKVGRWMHALMVRSLVEGGVRQLLSTNMEKRLYD